MSCLAQCTYENVVVNMAKAKQWEDVRLLSFDLQTVEFTYASVRDVSLPTSLAAARHLITTRCRTTHSPYPAKTSSSQVAHIASNLGVSPSQGTTGMIPGQTRTPKPSPSCTRSYARAGSRTPYLRSYPSCATLCQYLRCSHVSPRAQYRRPPGGGA